MLSGTARLLVCALCLVGAGWRFEGVTAQRALDTNFQRRSEGDTYFTGIHGYCQHTFGAKLHGGWTLLSSSDIDAAVAGNGRTDAALSILPPLLPQASTCAAGLVGTGDWHTDGSVFNASTVCGMHPENPTVFLGEVDIRGRPSTCGCLQAPQCDRGKACTFDCGCAGGNGTQVEELVDAVYGAEVVQFHAQVQQEGGGVDNVTCVWNATQQRECFALTGGSSVQCPVGNAAPSPLPVLLQDAGLVQAAAANGSIPQDRVGLLGYVLRVFPSAGGGNDKQFVCRDPEASTYLQWDCVVNGLYTVLPEGSNATVAPPVRFQQQFDMFFVPGAAATASPALLLGLLSLGVALIIGCNAA